jgi:hypothetical protein
VCILDLPVVDVRLYVVDLTPTMGKVQTTEVKSKGGRCYALFGIRSTIQQFKTKNIPGTFTNKAVHLSFDNESINIHTTFNGTKIHKKRGHGIEIAGNIKNRSMLPHFTLREL